MFGHSHQCNEGHFWPPHGRTRQLRARESTDTPTFALWDPIGHRRVEHKQSHQWDRGIWCKGGLLGQRDSRGWASQSLSWLGGPGWVRLLPGRLWQRELFQQREEIQSHHSNLARGESNGCMPVRAVCKPHSPDLKRGALATDARGCSLWRTLLEHPPPAPESRVGDPLGELVRTRVGGVTLVPWPGREWGLGGWV